MRIIIISPLPINLEEIKGGVESATINLLDGFGLIKNDIQVQVISFNQYIVAYFHGIGYLLAC